MCGLDLARKIFGFLRETRYQSNLKVCLAISGGSDSMALAQVVVKYAMPHLSKDVVIVHINHGWRGVESDGDQKLVEDFAKSHNIPCYVYACPSKDKTISPEKEASDQRKEVFQTWVNKGYTIFTAHTANDLLETMLWRLCDGKLETHDKGILIETEDGQFRPFLTTTKEELQEFLLAEKIEWREDKTNFDGRLMRSKLRMNVVPELIKIYPQAVRKVSQAAIKKQRRK